MITYIIVDDETASHEIIEDYGSNLAYLKLQKNCYNALEAIEYLREHTIDLIFLDINMPKLTGFDFLKALPNPPKIIVTTAYKEFALEGYELNIDDYLLKPFSFQRFLKAVTKVQEEFSKETQSENDSIEEAIFIKDQKKYYQVKLKDIFFVEAFGNYIKLHLENQMIMTHQTLSSFEKQLPEGKFIKIHKSFIVAIDRIELVEGNQLFIQKHTLPIGKAYRSNIDGLLR